MARKSQLRDDGSSAVILFEGRRFYLLFFNNYKGRYLYYFKMFSLLRVTIIASLSALSTILYMLYLSS